MTIYFGFAISSTMFDSDDDNDFFIITRKVLSSEAFKVLIKESVQSCVNPSHAATISAIKSRFGIEIEIPEFPPIIKLGHDDTIIVAQVSGLPRLTDRHEYTESEIQSANIKFVRYKVSILTAETTERMRQEDREIYG